MAVAVQGTPTGVGGAASNTTATLTIPAGAVAGDIAYYFTQQGGTATRTINATNAWTEDQTVLGQTQGGNCTLTCFTRTLTGTDPGTTISTTFASAQNYAAGLIVFTGGTQDATCSSPTEKTPASTTDTFPAVTPTVDDCMVVYAIGSRAGSTSTTVDHGVPTSYTEQVEGQQTTGAVNRHALAIGTRLLTGGNGAAQTPASVTSTSATSISVTFTVAPSGPTDISGSDTGSAAEAGTVAAALAGADTGSDAEAGNVAFTGSDTGSGGEASTPVAALTGADTPSGADSALSVALNGPDTAGSAEAAAALGAVLAGADTAAGADTGALDAAATPTGTDTSGGTDTAVSAAALSGADTATGASSNGTPAAALAAADTGSAAQTTALAVTITAADVATAADLMVTGVPKTGADLAATADGAAPGPVSGEGLHPDTILYPDTDLHPYTPSAVEAAEVDTHPNVRGHAVWQPRRVPAAVGVFDRWPVRT